jgi:hypothetical protein
MKEPEIIARTALKRETCEPVVAQTGALWAPITYCIEADVSTRNKISGGATGEVTAPAGSGISTQTDAQIRQKSGHRATWSAFDCRPGSK